MDIPAARPDQAMAPPCRWSCSSPSSRITLWISCGLGGATGALLSDKRAHSTMITPTSVATAFSARSCVSVGTLSTSCAANPHPTATTAAPNRSSVHRNNRPRTRAVLQIDRTQEAAPTTALARSSLRSARRFRSARSATRPLVAIAGTTALLLVPASPATLPYARAQSPPAVPAECRSRPPAANSPLRLPPARRSPI